MIQDGSDSPARVRDRLAGEHILLTGATGFLAKIFVEKILRSVETIGGLHLLVRPKSDGTPPEQRVKHDVLRSSAFDRLRAAHGERFEALCREKIHVVGGDLTHERFGLPKDRYQELASRITLVVNSAATVTFDERLDLAIELNTLGPQRLLQFARDTGDVPFMHVSTAYVCGQRTGAVVEDFSAPEPARESLPRVGDSGAFDLDGIVDTLRGEAVELRHRFAADQEACRRQLIDAGMNWARRHGWNDTYTFTKWLGEQLLVRDHGKVPLVIFRPAIIEGSFDEPTPGWMDGLRMADPIIVAYGKGRLNQFPGRGDIALDLIPVDFVANAMIATLPVGEMRSDKVAVYQCASSDRNPMFLERMRQALITAYRKRPMIGDDGRPIYPKPMRVVTQDEFVGGWKKKQSQLAALERVFRVLGMKKRARRMFTQSRKIDPLLYFAKIYSPYTHLDCRFADDNLRAAAERLHPDDREAFHFDVERVDWDDYLINRHVPGLRSYVLGTGGEPTGRIRAVEAMEVSDAQAATTDVLKGGTIFDVFARAAARYGDKPMLQVRRESRWLRYTYKEAEEATVSITRRLAERGLRPGDRIAICAGSCPEWALTYLAAMRAGMAAIPLDPELPPKEAWAHARFSGARLMCAGKSTFDGLRDARGGDDAEVVLLREPFIPRPAASRDGAPEPVSVDGNAVASILFTSGTTVSPKAVQLTHRNLLANARALLAVHPVYPSDELLSVLPLYHAFEFTGGFLVPMIGGATITYVDRLKGPDVQLAMNMTGTTAMLVVPRLLRMFLDSIEHKVDASGTIVRTLFGLMRRASNVSGYRLGRFLFRRIHREFGGRLRMFVSGGSRLDPELYDAFSCLGFNVYEGYGLTETAPVLTVNPPGKSVRGSVGPPLSNVDLQIRNPSLERVGEVWVKGPNVMSGYLDNPDATAEVLVDGWFRTGDLGRVDEDGWLYLTGRSKDLIVTSAGKNVYPDEVEARYRDLPFVKEVCVFGMTAPDGLGDAVHAVVVVDPDRDPELDRASVEREIRTAAGAIAAEMPQHQHISQFHFWQRELPKTSTLKAKRGLIRDIVASERSGNNVVPALDAPQPDDESYLCTANEEATRAVLAIVSQASKRSVADITPHMHLHLELGIDSIGRIDVLGALESTFNMHIDNEAGVKAVRVIDLIRLAGDRHPTGSAVKRADVWERRLKRDAAHAESNGTLPTALKPLRWMVRGTLGAFMNTYVRVRVKGRVHIPESGPFILAPNHSSHLDSPSVIAAIGGKRRVWIAGAEDYFFNTRLKRLVFGKMLDTIAFDRHADGVSGLRRCGAAFDRGDGLLMFPEGTRSVSGEMQAFKIGVAVLAIERGVPIVPVHIASAYDLWPKGQRFVRPGAIVVSFGKPVNPPSRDEIADHYAAFQSVTKEVERAVRAMAAGSRA